MSSSGASPVATGLATVEARLTRACASAGKPRSEVSLLAVSKRHPVERIREAYALGVRDFGENYAQEMDAKRAQLSDLEGLRWHFIGTFQRNKAAEMVRAGACVHGLASLRGVETLARRAAEAGVILPVFVQVNLASEAGKAGCDEAALPELLSRARALPELQTRGLMLMPPDRPAEQNRLLFRRLRALVTEHGLSGCSMGMSGDLEVAVEEGSTLIRVGTAIFGQRPVSP